MTKYPNFTKQKSFCSAPWLHYYRSPTGDHRLLKEIEENTEEDGTTDVNPISLDYRFLNCNLTCLTCNPEFSSKWKTLEKIKSNNQSFSLVDRQFILKDYKDSLNKYTWEKVYFAGGEPLLQTNHLQDLETLMIQDQKLEHGMRIYYNTNLSRSEAFIKGYRTD